MLVRVIIVNSADLMDLMLENDLRLVGDIGVEPMTSCL